MRLEPRACCTSRINSGIILEQDEGWLLCWTQLFHSGQEHLAALIRSWRVRKQYELGNGLKFNITYFTFRHVVHFNMRIRYLQHYLYNVAQAMALSFAL